MTNDDRPVVPGGGSAAPSAADLPDKLRVHALAKLLGLPGKDVLAGLAEIGSPVKGVQSSVDRDTALRVVAVLLPDPTEPGGDLPEEIEDGALAAPLVPVFAPPQPLFLAPDPDAEPAPRSRARSRRAAATEAADETTEATGATGVAEVEQPAPTRRTRSRRGGQAVEPEPVEAEESQVAGDVADDIDDDEDGEGRRRRRRGRRGRGRGRAGQADGSDDDADDDEADGAAAAGDEPADGAAGSDDDGDEDDDEAGGSRRRRRRRRRRSADSDDASRDDDPPDTVVHVREPKPARERPSSDDEVQGVRGSTRLEAKRQRRRDGREAGRRRPPILSESEFLARREAVERVMVVREHRGSANGHGQHGPGVVQIGVLEDGVLVEHFVTSSGSGSLVGNVYLGRVQNVLPSMEAAFVDIGRGRNAVLYAGEVDWDAAGLEGKARKIEQALSTGDSVLVQVTKDPVGHKGARLTTQISLPGRFLVYVPGGGATGISRKLPDTERKRLKDILRRIVPDDAGVIIRTASEGVPEESLARDVTRLQAQWDVIRKKADVPRAPSPQLLYAEPDLLIKVVRDLFTEDFASLVVQGGDAMETISSYVEHVAPELAPRLKRHVGNSDVFTEHRIDEQILKALDRKVWLPSGGYLVIDRTEAMTVIDVNTGKFTGSGGNLEETVTRNNLEAAEEVVRQLRLRDIGGIIVIDFIDMVLEGNRDLVLRRLTECLGRDRTRHQVAEVTSLGLVQMTRKRVGHGLLEAFSTPCEHCRGRGVVVTTEPTEAKGGGNGGGNGQSSDHGGGDHGRGRRPRGKDRDQRGDGSDGPSAGSSGGAKAAEPAVAAPEPAAAASPDAPATDAPAPSRRRGRKRGGDTQQPDSAAEAAAATVTSAATAEAPADAPVAAVVAAEPTADVASLDGEPVAARPSGRVRSRGRRAAADPDTAAATAPQPADSPTQPARAAAPAPAAATAPGSTANGSNGRQAVEPAVAADQADEGSTPARPRRRRAASRPAGPPAAEVQHTG